MSKPDYDRFLQLLKESSLLEDSCVADARPDREAIPETFAENLVKLGHLTRWQSRELLAGRSGPFFVGQYRILRPLGRGGMGSVFKAIQPGINRTVALKVMSRKTLRDERFRARFLREIRAAAALDHPHIIHAFDAGCTNGTYYLVMEYLAGRDLKHWIRAMGQLPVDWSCECVVQAALGLQHAQERGIVHRDIKPSNLLLMNRSTTEWPHVKIVDFGLARAAQESAVEAGLTRIGQALGTSEYVAPEQAQDSTKVDSRADIYSLGCTLFELFTGRLPFEGNSPVERLLARFEHDAPLVSSLRPSVPAELDQVVARMLNRDPDRRFQTPAEAAQALAPFARKGHAAPSAVEIRSDGERLTQPAPSSATDTDPIFDQLLESFAEQHSSRTFSALSNPARAGLFSAEFVLAIAAVAALLIYIICWILGTRG